MEWRWRGEEDGALVWDFLRWTANLFSTRASGLCRDPFACTADKASNSFLFFNNGINFIVYISHTTQVNH